MEWLTGGLGIAVVAMAIKILAMKRSVRNIRRAFSSLVKGDSNSLITVSSRDRDICHLASEINETLQEQRKMYLLYHQGDRELKTAITNISHDLRTPLTAISGYLELLRGEKTSETVRRYLSVIEARTAFMKQLTEEMFDYSLITSAEEEALSLETVDLNRMLEDCILQYHAALCERQIDLTVRISETKILRQLNRIQIERVFSNLISNALKYSDGDLDISLSDEGLITFSNRAAGLTPLQTERLFGRFYTVENGRSATGLGLAIARAFVAQMQGEIWAEYRSDRLCIMLRFPPPV